MALSFFHQGLKCFVADGLSVSLGSGTPWVSISTLQNHQRSGTQGDFKFAATLLPSPYNCWEYECVVAILQFQFLGDMIFLKNL